MGKYRSLDAPYTKWIIKEYKYWTLLLNDDQRYLGRAYVWLVREGGMQRFSEVSDDEYSELRIVMYEYEQVLKELWNPDFMNYAWLANLISEHGGHGHLHLTPRYKDTRAFASIKFTDGRWGKNFSPSEEFKPSEEILVQILHAVKEKIS
jgi:diadenosine tetraphosphate (Ap4A) HIT family hydrolase